MNLLDDIISGVTETKESTSDLLRRCLVLAYRLKNDTLKNWVESELNGYEDESGLPEYRKGTGVAKGLFFGPLNQQLNDQPLASAILEKSHRHFATDIELNQPIAAYEDMKIGGHGIFEWPANLVLHYQNKFIQGYALNRAWMEIPASMMVSLVDTVRTRILTFALEIRDKLPEDSEKGITEIPAPVVERVVQITILGGNNVFGSVQEFNAPTVIAGDAASLQRALTALGLADDDINALKNQMKEDGALAVDDQSPKSIGEKTMQWIKKTAMGGGKKGLEIGGAVLEEALKRAVSGYLGL